MRYAMLLLLSACGGTALTDPAPVIAVATDGGAPADMSPERRAPVSAAPAPAADSPPPPDLAQMAVADMALPPAPDLAPSCGTLGQGCCVGNGCNDGLTCMSDNDAARTPTCIGPLISSCGGYLFRCCGLDGQNKLPSPTSPDAYCSMTAGVGVSLICQNGTCH